MNMIKIEEISLNNIQKASQLANNVFNSREVLPSVAFEASLNDIKFKLFKKELFDEHEINLIDLDYWVAIDGNSNEVLGVIGLYSTEDDHDESSWISWFCIEKRYRGKRIGTKLLEYVIKRSREDMKSYIRLFTSTDPKEAAAQILYNKMGFRIMEERGRKKRGIYEIFYRELSLN